MLRIRTLWVVAICLSCLLASPAPTWAQDYQIWLHDRPASQFRIFTSDGQQVRTIPFAWHRDAQFIPTNDGSTVYFAWGTNGFDQQTWKLDVATGSTQYLFNNEWAVITGFVPGSHETKLLSSGSFGEIWQYDTSTGALTTWQDNDLLPSQFGFNTFRYELAFADNGTAVVRVGHAGGGGEAVLLGTLCNADSTHHLCNLRVLSNPGGGSSSWANIAGNSGIDPTGRYAFFKTVFNGTHQFWRRNLGTGQDTPVWSGDGITSVVVTAHEVLFSAPIPAGVGRAIFACDVDTVACRTVLVGGSNIEYFRVLPIVDQTPPEIVSSVTGTVGSNNWYTSNVSVRWLVSDDESEGTTLTTTGCEEQALTEDTAGLTITCSASSAGGHSSETVTIRRDATKPEISGSRSPTPNSAGWNNTSLAVTFSCADAMSGIASCVGDTSVTTEGIGQFVTGTATDEAGNRTSIDLLGINVDLTGPIVTISSPLNGATFTLGQLVTARYACVDALSGTATCTLGQGDPVDTGSVGPHTISAAGSDLAGNVTTVVAHYGVTYSFRGFEQPTSGSHSTFKAGSTIPVKFVLTDASGVSAGTAVASVSVNGGPSLGTASYDPAAERYRFNLKTSGLPVGRLTISVTLDDGTTHSVVVTLR